MSGDYPGHCGHMTMCVLSSDCYVAGNECCMGWWNALDPTTGEREWINTLACVNSGDLNGDSCVSVEGLAKGIITAIIVAAIICCLFIVLCCCGCIGCCA